MAKKSKISREKHLAKKVKRHYLLRKELRDLIKNPKTSEEDKLNAIKKLQKLPRSSSHVRLTNRLSLIHI